MSLISKQKVEADDYSSGGGEIVPGIYGFKVLEAEIKAGKNGDYISMKMQLYTDNKEELCWAWHQLFHNSSAQFCIDNISRFLTITGISEVNSVGDLVGKCGLVGIKTAEYTNKHGDVKVGADVQPNMVFRYKDKASASEIDKGGAVGERYKEAAAILAKSELKKAAPAPAPTANPVANIIQNVTGQKPEVVPVDDAVSLPF